MFPLRKPSIVLGTITAIVHLCDPTRHLLGYGSLSSSPTPTPAPSQSPCQPPAARRTTPDQGPIYPDLRVSRDHPGTAGRCGPASQTLRCV
ncbi:hypothetical protein LZ32DRAFT_600428 [Colletotrichum eremochloae]|nr:hypothetical protein LZ32DRAFT_600428 [Colletotrichum eremochloae]